MDPLLTSTFAVAIAEIGDKTQLLSLILAARFANKWAIICGILVATVINHGLSAYLGLVSAQFLDQAWVQYVISGSFILVGLWLLIPDNMDNEEIGLSKYGPFIVTAVLFFLAEIGDKTQVATILLGAQYQDVLIITIGTTIGMLLANIPVIWFGKALMRRLPLNMARFASAGFFILLGALYLLD